MGVAGPLGFGLSLPRRRLELVTIGRGSCFSMSAPSAQIRLSLWVAAWRPVASSARLNELRPWPVKEAPQPAMDHMEFNFMPKGHPGFEAPHYDVHMYFVPAELLDRDKQARQAAAH